MRGGECPTNPYCRVVEPYLTQFKLASARTPFRRADVQLAATLRAFPARRRRHVIYPSRVLAPSLGRPLAGNVATARST